jgi:hypothetical protein
LAAISSPRAFLMSLLLGMSWACSDTLDQPDDGIGHRELLFTFDGDAQGWSGNFTDVSAEHAQAVGFVFEHRPLPAEVGGAGGALFLSGENVSDDLFLFLTYPVTGLRPNTRYDLTFELELASNAPAGCLGIGGDPGGSVFLKVGAALVPPDSVMTPSGGYRLNVDKGNQSSDGANAQVVGDIANSSRECNRPSYQRITRDNRDRPFRITTDGQGQLWLLVGTDSGFEGATALYYDTLRVVLEPS